MKRMHLLRLGCAALALAVLGAFNAQAQTPTKVKIRLDWKAGAQHAPFYLGKQRGYYKDEGIDLDVISGSGSSDTVKQIGSKAVEFGLVDALVLVQGAQQRVPAKSIAAYYQRTPIVLISPQAKPVTNPRQLLDGIKLGSKKGSATFQGLIALLAANNMTARADQARRHRLWRAAVIGQAGRRHHGLLDERADRGGERRYGRVADADLGLWREYLRTDDRGEPGLHAAEAEVVKAFMKATLRSVAETIKDPAAAVSAISAAVAETDTKREAKVLDHTLPYWQSKETDTGGFGWQTTERWRDTIDVARKLGLIETALKTEDVFVNTYLAK